MQLIDHRLRGTVVLGDLHGVLFIQREIYSLKVLLYYGNAGGYNVLKNAWRKNRTLRFTDFDGDTYDVRPISAFDAQPGETIEDQVWLEIPYNGAVGVKLNLTAALAENRVYPTTEIISLVPEKGGKKQRRWVKLLLLGQKESEEPVVASSRRRSTAPLTKTASRVRSAQNKARKAAREAKKAANKIKAK